MTTKTSSVPEPVKTDAQIYSDTYHHLLAQRPKDVQAKILAAVKAPDSMMAVCEVREFVQGVARSAEAEMDKRDAQAAANNKKQ